MQIGTDAIEIAIKDIGEKLRAHNVEIDQAYLDCDNDLTVSLKVKFQPTRQGNILMKVSIAFPTGKVSDFNEYHLPTAGQKSIKFPEKKKGE